jgi:alpha-mannosidase
VPARATELDRDELLDKLARLIGDPVGALGIQAIEIVVTGDVALVEVVLAPLPPVAEAVERCQAALKTVLADQTLRHCRLRESHYVELDVSFVASGVPAYGYKAFAVQAVPQPAPARAQSGGPRIENEFFSVEADPSSGTFTVTDKGSGARFPQLHRLVDGGDRGDEYNYCPPENDILITAPTEPPSIRLLAADRIRQTLEVAQSYLIPVSLTDDRTDRSNEMIRLPVITQVCLSSGVPRVDVTTTVENRARDHRLRVCFPTRIATDVSHAEGHFDVVTRSIDLPPDTQDWPEQPVPAHPQRTFVDVNDGHLGLLVANRGLSEYEVIPGEEGVTVALTLLRCVGWLSRDDLHCRQDHAGPGLPAPGAQCLGTHTFEYALVPHRGGWRNAYAQAHAFSAPLRAVGIAKSGGSLPLAFSFIDAEPSEFVLTAIKLPQNGEGLVVRGTNIADDQLSVTLRLGRGWRRVTEVRLDENALGELNMEGNLVRFVAAPKRVVTLRFDE